MSSAALSHSMQSDATKLDQLAQRLLLNTALRKGCACFALLFLQFIWLLIFSAPKTAMLNMVPGLVFVPLLVFFTSLAWSRWQHQYLFLGLFVLLSFRLPITINEKLLFVNWAILIAFLTMLVHWLVTALVSQHVGRALWICIAVFVFNGVSHMSLDSPFTHTFHLMNDVPSNFQGVDNNQTWECAYEVSFFAVHCDARHFVAAERVFTEPDYDASFSVVLPRYFDGYLKSFIGTEGTRWLASMVVHLIFWLFSCAAIFRFCLLAKLPLHTAQAAMVAIASGWGFVSMFAQPAPYFISYAFGAISLWAVAELVLKPSGSWQKELLYVLLLVCSTLTYEAYPLMVASWVLLGCFGRWRAALIVAAAQVVGSLMWKYVGLGMILGTMGDLNSESSGVSNISKDFNVWFDVITSVNVPEFIRLSWVGIQAYAFGNLVYGALAGFGVVLFCYKRLHELEQRRFFWYSVTVMNVLVLGAALFIVPQMFHWSPATGMQPRITYFSFPLNTAALCFLFSLIQPRAVWSVPVFMFLLANIDITGLASQAMMFDYGRVGVLWFK